MVVRLNRRLGALRIAPAGMVVSALAFQGIALRVLRRWRLRCKSTDPHPGVAGWSAHPKEALDKPFILRDNPP